MAGIMSRAYSQRLRTYDAGCQEMVRVATEAARDHTIDEKSLRLTLAEIVRRSYEDGATVNQALRS